MAGVLYKKSWHHVPIDDVFDWINEHNGNIVIDRIGLLEMRYNKDATCKSGYSWYVYTCELTYYIVYNTDIKYHCACVWDGVRSSRRRLYKNCDKELSKQYYAPPANQRVFNYISDPCVDHNGEISYFICVNVAIWEELLPDDRGKLINYVDAWHQRNDRRRAAASKRLKIAIIAAAIVALGVAVALLIRYAISPASKYAAAVSYYEAQRYEDAYNAFRALDYRDSADRAAECLYMKQMADFRDLSVGSRVMFGWYEQDNNAETDQEEIEWRVLEIKDNKALLLSSYILDYQPFDETEPDDITWATCTLRAWLNGAFYHSAFSLRHQQHIVRADIIDDDYAVEDDEDVVSDNVFLLSLGECCDYLTTEAARQCKETTYARNRFSISGDRVRCWWLRTHQSEEWFYFDGNYVATYYVDANGSATNTSTVGFERGIRPAIWVDLGD